MLGPDRHAVRLIGIPTETTLIPIAIDDRACWSVLCWLYRRDSPRFAELA